MPWRCRIRSLRIECARSTVAGSPLISAPARARPLTHRRRPQATVLQRSAVHQVGAGTGKTSFVASPSPLPRRVAHKVCAPGRSCRTGRWVSLVGRMPGFRPGDLPLDRLELLERLATALAVAQRPARRRAEDVLEGCLRRIAVRAAEDVRL